MKNLIKPLVGSIAPPVSALSLDLEHPGHTWVIDKIHQRSFMQGFLYS